jgi:hypothetical protein
MHEAKSVREAVKALGGGQVVGDFTRTSRFAVHNWVKRDQIPGHHYGVMNERASAVDLRIPDDLYARVLVHPRDVKERHDNPVSDNATA